MGVSGHNTPEIVDFLKGISFQYPEKLEEQLTELRELFNKESKVSRRYELVSQELRVQFGGGSKGFSTFIEEITEKSGYYLDSENERYMPLTEGLSIFDLLKIAERYQPPSTQFKPKSLSSGKKPARKSRRSLHARFETIPLSIVYNSFFKQTRPKAVCTKNREAHSLAGYQDAADPFTHNLSLSLEEARKEGKTSHQLLEAIVIETEKVEGGNDKNGNDDGCLLVEGVFGVVDEEMRESVFDYIYSCLIKYVYEEKKNLLFNLSFNPGSQHLPLHFINWLGWKKLNKVFYEFSEEGKRVKRKVESIEEHSCELQAVRLSDSERAGLEERVGDCFDAPQEVLDRFDREKRYSDTWWWISGKSECNMREGSVHCLEINREMIKEEYERLFVSNSFSIKRLLTTGLFGLLFVGGLIGLLHQSGLLKIKGIDVESSDAGKFPEYQSLEKRVRWSSGGCSLIGIEERDPLCKVVGSWDFEDKTEFERIIAVQQYFPIFCSAQDRNDLDTIWGLNFIAKNADKGNKEKFMRRILSGDCGNQALVNLLTYPCDVDNFDYLEPLSFCPSDLVRFEMPPDYIINGYANTDFFMGRVLLLARMGPENSMVFMEAEKMYSKVFLGEAGPGELEFIGKYHDLDRLKRFYLWDHENRKEGDCDSDEQNGWKHLMRLNIVKLLRQTDKGRAFLEQKFWKSKKPEEIVSIGRYLLPLQELSGREKFLRRYTLTLAGLGVADSNIYGDESPGQFRLEDCIEKKREVTTGCLYLDCMVMAIPSGGGITKCDLGVHH